MTNKQRAIISDNLSICIPQVIIKLFIFINEKLCSIVSSNLSKLVEHKSAPKNDDKSVNV